MPYKNPEDQRRYNQAHYRANTATYKAKAVLHNKKQQAIARALVVAAKARPCTDCGVQYPYYVMHFDHVGDDKEFNIGDWTKRRWSIAKLRAEMAKCDVVCANCHAERTHQRQCKRPCSSLGRASAL